MSQALKIMVIVIFVMVVTKIILRLLGRNEKEDTNILIIWALLEATAVFTHSLHLVLVVLIVVKLFYLKNDIQKNITTYFALLAALPFHYAMNFPHPSIPLFLANYQRLALIIWILPIMPAIYHEASNSGRKALFDLPILFLFGITIFRAFGEHYGFPITLISSIKEIINFSLNIVIPYFVIVYWVNSWKRLKLILYAFMLGGIALSVFSIVEALTSWNIYKSMGYKGMRPTSGFSPFREGFLRSKVTFPESIAFGIHIIFVMGLSIPLLLRTKKKLVIKAGVITLFMGAIFFTQSRGDYLATAVFLAAFVYYFSKPWKKFAIIVIMAAAIPVATYIYNQQSPAGVSVETEEVDEYGTFEYRKRLYFALMTLIPQYPFFGNPLYMAEPEMQALKQGQGIIDPVNTYLTLAAKKGLIALFFFVFLIVRAVNVGRKYIKYGHKKNNKIYLTLGAALSAVVIAIAVALVSMAFNQTVQLAFWFLMAIARSMQLNMKARSGFTSIDKEL